MRRLEGLYVRFAQRLDPEANARIHALCDRLLSDPLRGVTDLYPGYINLFVEFDAAILGRPNLRAWVKRHLRGLEPKPAGREVTVPVRYDGEDLEWIAEQTGLGVEAVIRLHSERCYRVYTVGFVPGQPMLGTLEPRLQLPRRTTPRARVPANTVAMAGAQTCIYALPTPGGWHLLGTAMTAVYDPHREHPFLLEPGDTVRFLPGDGPSLPEAQVLETLPTLPRFPAFEVESAGLLDLLVDGGRPMAARFGMAQAGPMDARSARLASAVVGNHPEDALLELTLRGPVLRALRDVVVGFAGFGMVCLLDGAAQRPGLSLMVRSGQRLSFEPIARGVRAYLAVAGGFELTPYLGSRSVDLRGLIGRALRRGDLLGTDQPRRARAGFFSAQSELPSQFRIRLQPGPQVSREALEALGSGEYRVAASDRMGVRLEGPKVPGGELVSEATPLGAVQITTHGDPILLLNDRGRIGGYAKPAVIDPRDLPLAAQLRPGQRFRFVVPGGARGDHWVMEARGVSVSEAPERP